MYNPLHLPCLFKHLLPSGIFAGGGLRWGGLLSTVNWVFMFVKVRFIICNFFGGRRFGGKLQIKDSPT